MIILHCMRKTSPELLQSACTVSSLKKTFRVGIRAGNQEGNIGKLIHVGAILFSSNGCLRSAFLVRGQDLFYIGRGSSEERSTCVCLCYGMRLSACLQRAHATEQSNRDKTSPCSCSMTLTTHYVIPTTSLQYPSGKSRQSTMGSPSTLNSSILMAQ